MSAYIDDEPRDAHSLACPIWQSPDPDVDCDCFEGGVVQLLDRYESYGPKQHSHADGAP
jgi:hypothetical protein